MNDLCHGYGIFRWADGSVYYGEWKENISEGQGPYKWADGDEYCGEWKNNKKWGEGVKKENGQLYRDKYEAGNRISRSKISEGS